MSSFFQYQFLKRLKSFNIYTLRWKDKMLLCTVHFVVAVQLLSPVRLRDPMHCSMPDFPVLHCLPKLAQTRAHWVTQPSHPLSPLLLLPSIFPSLGVFSSESALHTRWPKYQNFSFNTNPSNEYSVLIFFRIDWLNLLTVQGTLKSLLECHSLKAPVLLCIHDYWKNHTWLYGPPNIHTWLLEKP